MEIEARVKVDDLEKVKSQLTGLGAEFYKEKVQVDSIFKRKGEELAPQGPGGFILRVRESDKNTLTLKALTEKAGVWVEHETEVSNVEEAKQILLKADFSKVFTMTKKRISGRLGDFELCLDDIKELGTYIEVALDSPDSRKSKEKIVRLLNKLGFEESQIIHKGYVAMLFERLGVTFSGTG
jgi:predicted adenylyl cyclase CyaB